MIGSVIGDIIGSVYEHKNIKTTSFPLFSPGSTFTDDTVLTIAIGDSLLNNRSYIETLKKYGRKYPYAGYGVSFYHWIFSDSNAPYGSWGNGAAMRVGPIGFRFETLDEVMVEAKRCAEVTHNHKEGIKGAQATASSIFLSRIGRSKIEIKEYIETTFNYNLNRSIDDIRPVYQFDVSCQGSVPEAIIAFLDSKDFVDAIRKAISIGGDSDTLACIAGGIAEAFYKKIPLNVLKTTKRLLPGDFLSIIEEFEKKYKSYNI